jgi:hypothetical protein
MNEVDTAERILRFYQECLQGTPPVASMDVIRDSQTRDIPDGRKPVHFRLWMRIPQALECAAD